MITQTEIETIRLNADAAIARYDASGYTNDLLDVIMNEIPRLLEALEYFLEELENE